MRKARGLPQTLTFVHGEVSVNGHYVYLLKQLKQKVGHWTNSMWRRPEHLGSLLLVPYRCGLKLVNFLELSSLPFVGCRLSSCLNCRRPGTEPASGCLDSASNGRRERIVFTWAGFRLCKGWPNGHRRCAAGPNCREGSDSASAVLSN